MKRRQQRGGSPAFAVLLFLTILFAVFAAFAQGGSTSGVEIVIPRCSPIETYDADDPKCGANGIWRKNTHDPWTPPEAKLRDWGTGQWSTADTVRQTAYGVLWLMDLSQTRYAMKHPEEGWVETNIVLGEHPSLAAVHRYAAIVFALHTLVAYNLDPPERRGMQYGFIVIEALVVNHNRNIGAGFDWPLVGMKFAFF